MTDTTDTTKIDLARNVLFLRHSQMLINERYKKGEFKIPLHLGMGHEAIAAAVDAIMQEGDQLVCSHRNMHYVLARGKNLKVELDEYYLKKEGLARGELGSMNLADEAHSIPYSSSILGNNLSVATGLALAKRVSGKNNIVIVQSGDGAIEEGSFYESLLFLKSHNLCCMVIVENNGYSLGTHITERRCDINLQNIAKGLAVHYEKLSGNDVFAYAKRLNELRDYCIRTRTPICIEVILTTLGNWYLTNAQNPHGTFVNYHSGPAPTVQMSEWPVILMNNEDPVFALMTHIDKDTLVQESKKMLARLQEEIA